MSDDTPTGLREVVPPAVVDGALVRLVSDGCTEWVQQWTGERWIDGGATVDEALRGPTAGADTLARFHYRPSPA